MSDLLERLRAALADRYAIESEIGRGGMAVVFLAEDLRHHRQVALKVLHPELTATLGAERFLHEIEIVAGLQHPHIFPLYDSGEADGLLYYVMPYAEGESLRQRLDREKQLAVDESVRIAVEVADGLDYAHRKGVVHRDIKPGNILLSEKHAVIADFGIARAIEAARAERVTRTGLGVGTPLYASPEQATAEETLDGRTDIYSLGCMLYEMLAGEPPLTGATPQMTHARRISETPTHLHTLRDTVPPALDHVIGRALAKIPADRYATASQFGQALQAALFAATPAAHADLSATPGLMTTTPITPAPEPKKKVPRWLWLAVPAIAAAVAAAVIFGQLSRSVASDSTALDAADEVTAMQLTRDGKVSQAVISPDGSQLVVAMEERGGATRIAVSEIGTAQPERTLAVVDWVRDVSWLPDGSGVVFSGTYMGRAGRYSVSPTGGTVEFIGSEGRTLVSPDGSECLSWSFNDPRHVEIDTLWCNRGENPESEGVDSIPVAGTYEWISGAAYSPRGNYFLVTTTGGTGTGSIRSVSRSGDDQRLVVEGGGRIESLYWRNDGRVLYYVLRLPSGPELMRLATLPTGEAQGVPEPLLQLGDSLAVGSISSDSRRLTLVKTLSEVRIVRLWPDGSGGVTVEPVAGTAEALEWWWVSPDGEWLAFTVKGSSGTDIYKVPIEGGTPERLTRSGNVRSFSWSPDSKMLAFIAPWRDTLKVWIVSAASGASMPLQGSVTSGYLEWETGPLMYSMPCVCNYWVVDSLRIRTDGGSVPLTPANLETYSDAYYYRGDSDGIVEGDGRTLVSNESVGTMRFARSSPDGRSVVVYWYRGDMDFGLWRLSLTDSTQVPVGAHTRMSWYGNHGWTADGSSIYTKVGNDMLYFPVDGGEPETALILPEEPAYACEPLTTGSETSWICAEGLSESDAWLIENFDPHVN